MKNEDYGDELFEIVLDPDAADATGEDMGSPDDDDDIRIADAGTDAAAEDASTAGESGEPPEPKSEESTVDEEPEQEAPAKTAAPADVNAQQYELSAEEEFAEEFDYVEHEQQDEAIMEEIGDSIISQVEKELIVHEDNVSPLPAGGGSDGPVGIKETLAAFFTRLPKWVYAAAGCMLFIILTMIWMLASRPGQSVLIRIGSHYIAGKVAYEPVSETVVKQLYEGTDMAYGDTVAAMAVDVPDDFGVITPEPFEPVEEDEVKTVYNILLLGEENIDTGGGRGRSDLIMIATLDLERKKLKLTSVLRDSLVAIPDHADNRINAAYTIGGVSLLYDTFRANLGIEFDNYMLVNFKSFEDIVNTIGGVDVELTEEEAEYLNTTNYISKAQYRNVVPGANHLNGNQALGYCRIRKVETKDHQHMDIGRTARQRRLMNSLFSSVGKLNYVELAAFADKCLGYVKTDLTSDRIELYLTALGDIGTAKIEECRIPVEGSYYDVRLRGMLVTSIDLKTNAEALRKFIYGK